jgi:hypothetical protein
MPAFKNSPFQKPQLLQKGVPAYLIGSFSQKVGNTHLGLLTDAIASNVATVTGTYLNGPLPVIGSLISIINSANSSGAFNVNRAVITAVSYVASTNIMTITFALTGSNQSATADGGTIDIEPAEVPESISATYISQAVLAQAPEGDSQFTLPYSVNFTTLPTSATVDLQTAMKASDPWTTIVPGIAVVAASAQTIGPFGQVTLQRGYLYRFNISAISGTAGVVAKIG